MSLDADEIRKIAHLARLTLDEADIPRHARELSGILELVEQMNAVDTEGVEPMAHPVETEQPLRAKWSPKRPRPVPISSTCQAGSIER